MPTACPEIGQTGGSVAEKSQCPHGGKIDKVEVSRFLSWEFSLSLLSLLAVSHGQQLLVTTCKPKSSSWAQTTLHERNSDDSISIA